MRSSRAGCSPSGAASLLIKLRRDPTFAFEMLQQMSHRQAYLEASLAELMERELESRQAFERVRAKAEYHMGGEVTR